MQTCPPPVVQPDPVESVVHVEVLTPGWQLWQEFDGLRAPEVYVVPPILQLVPHWPPAQNWPFPQDMPLDSVVQPDVLMAGVHTWQALFGLATPAP